MQSQQQVQPTMNKAGGHLNHIHSLNTGCPEGTEPNYYRIGGRVCKTCLAKKKGGNVAKCAKCGMSIEKCKCGGKSVKKHWGGGWMQYLPPVQFYNAVQRLRKKNNVQDATVVEDAPVVLSNQVIELPTLTVYGHTPMTNDYKKYTNGGAQNPGYPSETQVGTRQYGYNNQVFDPYNQTAVTYYSEPGNEAYFYDFPNASVEIQPGQSHSWGEGQKAYRDVSTRANSAAADKRRRGAR